MPLNYVLHTYFIYMGNLIQYYLTLIFAIYKFCQSVGLNLGNFALR